MDSPCPALGSRGFSSWNPFTTFIVLGFSWIPPLIQLYILQVINGITSSAQATMETAFLEDVTRKAQSGTDIRRYCAIMGVMAAIFNDGRRI